VYEIRLAPAAARDLARLDRRMQRRVATAIDRLAREPRPAGSTKLRGSDDIWWVRVGKYRVLYQVTDAMLLILVLRIGHRSNAYRR
jgi:mRNA interferase RelE/StbE